MTEPANATRLVLTGLLESDAPRLQEWRRDPEILNGALGYPFPSSLAAELEWIRSFTPRGTPQDICLAVRASADGVLLGYCLLRSIDWIARVAEFGIVVGPESRGSGVGRASLDLVRDFATRQLALRRIWLRVVDYNTRAIELYRSSGFELEGRLPRHVYRAGDLHDLLLFGWEAGSAR
jgi:RimJ/RimL family protein N-acetyltransferase